MYTRGQEYAKVGRVTVEIDDRSYRIRFTYPKGKRYSISVARVSPEGWTTAIKAAQLINRDIDLGDFDDTYARYSPKHAKRLEIASQVKEYNLLELWERYKGLNKKRIAQTSQNNLWKDCDRYLTKTPKKLLSLNNAQEFIDYLQGLYAASTIATLFRSCLHSAVNQALEAGLISKNPYAKIILPKHTKKKPECFTNIQCYY
ncbi:hypothetical protein Sta7437_1707 [Stanieria cyanosphaera PCC 7437]|uniref:Core-binding (CB) domain-containing protein n=1 Tax=Stanieria cyanosphaera (strain ATCC 29371 / PCC 7437) TaxID=111780 RepID=K9XT81_STAC7|nr:hypothetical protein [Stanieria cyanosphaera]AFZ35269.1 hypothetical protein Sta7437_1707 [Stanieria cyanosphaera PCC 7437]